MTIYIGDSLEWLKRLPSESVDCIVSSPPYFGKRDYGVAGQIGLEETPEIFIEKLMLIFREARRVLKDTGTCWINLGDSFWHNRSENGATWADGKLSKEYHARAGGKSHPVYKPKDLMFIPHRVAMSLQADGWWVRNDIVWHKPAPMPESVKDRCTVSKEYVFLCTKNEHYYFDADAIRETHGDNHWGKNKSGTTTKYPDDSARGRLMVSVQSRGYTAETPGHPLGRNKRDVWTIGTQPTGIEHFATMPQELAETCIKAGCPETVCAVCGAGYVREIGYVETDNLFRSSARYLNQGDNPDNSNHQGNVWKGKQRIGLSGFQHSCTCNGATCNGMVLDPFGGAATTALAAIKLNRHYQLIELNIRYVEIAQKRIRNFDPYQAKITNDGFKQLSLFSA